MTTRGKTMVGGATVLAIGAAIIGFLVFSGGSEAVPFLGGTGAPDEPETALCPLTGHETENVKAAGRTAVAVKIENSPQSRPQSGLNEADIVYEEPVEGGITRFIAIYQCEDADRVGPIRSARFVDPSVLAQYGSPVFGYSGAIGAVVSAVAQTGTIQDASQSSAGDAYELDPAKSAPHNVYSSSGALLQAGSKATAPPEPVFVYEEEAPERSASKRGRLVRVSFSPSSDVSWKYVKADGAYVRSHGETPHTDESGARVSATNIVVQMVELRDTGIIDAAGNPSPEVVAVGTGEVMIFRNGRLIEGTWERSADGETTRFLDANGDEIALAPGNTWIELFPNTLEVELP